MENTSTSLLATVQKLNSQALSAGISLNNLIHELNELTEFVQYLSALVNEGKLDEALYYVRNREGTQTMDKGE